jgi:menaquinone-specific isochorismate synthase
VTAAEGEVPVLTARTRAVDPVTSLLPLLDARSPLLFMRRGEGVAGLGEALRLSFRGPDRITQAAETWRRIAASARVDDAVRKSGSGLLAFGAFSFDERSAFESVLIVPRTIVGRRDGVSWVTEVTVAGDDTVPPAPEPTALGAEFRLSLQPGEVGPERFRELVTDAVSRIRQGELRKVVLARDLVGHVPEGGDLRRVLVDLALGYPDTWTFAIDGHIGSSPETLVRVNHGKVSARVLAGSIARGVDADADHAAALRLATSTKDLDEHRYAVQSVLDALAPHARSGISASEIPFALKLPNLWHLATNIEGALSDGSSALDLAAALHPTAAVAGTPTAKALEVIRELEPLDRGRYGGPPEGDIRAYAGGGILAASDPEVELAETKLKFRPMVESFG